MLTGTQRVYRMNNAPENFWQAVSPDLTENTEPGLSYRCISTVAGSQFDENKMAAGTTDGHLWITEDGGGNWTPMETGLPGQFITDVEFDPHYPDSMFCTVSGYRNADYEPYIFRAAIGGPWQSIQGNLPVHPVNQILPLTDSIWAVATDAGVFATNNWGNAWQPVGELQHNATQTKDATCRCRSQCRQRCRRCCRCCKACACGTVRRHRGNVLRKG